MMKQPCLSPPPPGPCPCPPAAGWMLPSCSTSVDTTSSLYFGHLVEKKDDKVLMGALKQFDTP